MTSSPLFDPYRCLTSASIPSGIPFPTDNIILIIFLITPLLNLLTSLVVLVLRTTPSAVGATILHVATSLARGSVQPLWMVRAWMSSGVLRNTSMAQMTKVRHKT